MSSFSKITEGLEKQFWIYTILTPVTMTGEVLMEMVIPYLMALVVDTGIASHNISYVLKTGTLMIVCALVSLFFGACGARFGAVASQGFGKNLRLRLFSKVQSFSFSNIDHFSTASLVTRLTTDVTNVQNVYQMLIRICFRAPFMLIAGTFMAFVINSRLAMIFLVAIPFLGTIIVVLSTLAYSRFALMLEKYDRMNTVVQENLIAIRVVKAFVRGKYEIQKFSECAEAVKNAQIRAERLVICLMPVMKGVVYACLISVFWFGGKMVVFGTMKTGEMISFLTYVSQILMNLMMIGMIFVNIVLSRASVRRILQVLDEKPEMQHQSESFKKEEGAESSTKNGSIDFEDVSFSYSANQEKLVLNKVSFHIEKGQTVGIIGGTGSSKTTLVSLIPGLYKATSGTVRVGGIDVRDYPVEVLRDKISVVLQKNVLFSGTIRENLLWGNENATREQLEEACIASDAHSFIQNFSAGYDTYLEPGGANLSGGQKQRLCIARALLKNPEILILDDSTSAVDTATEKKIRNSLKTRMPEATKIIIAQRITSVKEADIIFVMDEGKLVDKGTHQQLLESSRIYREVYESQQSLGDCDSSQ